MNSDWVGATQGVCLEGVNSSVRPDLIGTQQLAWMMNGAVRDGKPRTRPRLIERMVLPTGRIQGVGYFSAGGGMGITSVSGGLFRILINGNNFSYESIPLTFPNSSTLPMCWMVETSGSFLIQDGQSDCIIYNGASARRSNTAINEVPIARMMAYVNGRLFVAIGPTLRAGDITDPGIPGSELLFNETLNLNGGGDFAYPFPITALAGLPTNNTSSGYGSLIVYGSRFTDSLRAEITQRDLWQIVPGFQLIVLDGIGAVSQFGVTRVNQDLYWRDVNGEIRSLRSASADQNGPGNSSLSREVERIVNFETHRLLDQTSGMYFDNRLFFTASPFLHTGGITAYSKLISLDCAPLATMRGKAPPAYDGEWTGVNFVRLLTGNFNGLPRGFVLSSDDDGQNRLWEIDPDHREDVYLTDGTGSTAVVSPIEAFAEFRRFDFGDPSQLKQITRCDIYPTNIEGDVSIRLQWRAGNATQWTEVDEVAFCAKMTDPSTDAPHVWKNLASQERGRIKSFSFPQGVDPITQLFRSVGFSFQIRLIWVGNVMIDRIDIWAKPLKSPQYSNIELLDADCIQSDIQGNEITYTILRSGIGDFNDDFNDDFGPS